MKKWFSFLLAALLLVTACAGCGEKEPVQAPPSGIYYDITGIAPDEVLATVDGREVPAELYFYWLGYACSALEYQLVTYSYYGYYADAFLEDGSLNWDYALAEDMTLGQMAKEEAMTLIASSVAVEVLADRCGVTLTDENLAQIAEDRAEAVESLGGEEAFLEYLDRLGISQATFERITGTTYLFQDMLALVTEEGSSLYLAPADYEQYAAYADHILLSTQDASTGASLSEEEIAAKYATAQDLLEQLRAADDPVALFDQLADEYSEDPGRSAYPHGYFVTPDASFVAEFLDTAFALEPGQFSDIVESVYGYHILLRRDVQQYLAEDPTQTSTVAQQHMDTLVNLTVQDAEVVTSEALDAIDAGTFYTSYTAAVEALMAQDEADSGSEAGDTDDAGDAGDTEAGELVKE